MMQSGIDGLTNRIGLVGGVSATSGFKVIQRTGDELGNKSVEPDKATTDKASIASAVKKLNDYVAPALQTIEFSIDDETDRIVVKVVDTSTQKVLRQIPNEEVLAISKTLDKLQGLVVRQTA
jgi:flagellar protein FlaG